jgi:hypothetical protein
MEKATGIDQKRRDKVYWLQNKVPITRVIASIKCKGGKILGILKSQTIYGFVVFQFKANFISNRFANSLILSQILF